MGHRERVTNDATCQSWGGGTLGGVGHQHCLDTGEGATEHPQYPRRCWRAVFLPRMCFSQGDRCCSDEAGSSLMFPPAPHQQGRHAAAAESSR